MYHSMGIGPILQNELTKFDTTIQYVQSVLNHTTITSTLS